MPTVTETEWWQVTWESRLPATPPPPSPRALTGVIAPGLKKTQLAESADG